MTVTGDAVLWSTHGELGRVGVEVSLLRDQDVRQGPAL